MTTIQPTVTQFCHQTWQLDAQVFFLVHDGQSTQVVTDITPFHPVSHIWPDHPADQGSLSVKGKSYPIDDCLVGAIEAKSGQLYVAADIPVKRDTEGWVFVVVHQISTIELNLSVGDIVTLTVDQAYQDSLSRGHSAGHIAFLALNKVLAQNYWRKDADRKDSLGHYDFNSYAQVTSFVTPDLCTDKYRLGKTLKKRGLNVADMLIDLKTIELAVNNIVEAWLVNPVPVTMRLEGETLTSSRYWECELDQGALISIPCGGTHIKNTSDLGSITITLTQVDDQHIEMQTYVKR